MQTFPGQQPVFGPLPAHSSASSESRAKSGDYRRVVFLVTLAGDPARLLIRQRFQSQGRLHFPDCPSQVEILAYPSKGSANLVTAHCGRFFLYFLEKRFAPLA